MAFVFTTKSHLHYNHEIHKLYPTWKPTAESTAVSVVRAIFVITDHLFFASLVIVISSPCAVMYLRFGTFGNEAVERSKPINTI